jgi:protein-S-isoprenylcysteine O-methyltransferase Ste14
MSNPTPIALITLITVVVCWLAFAAVFILRRKPPKQQEAKRDRLSLLGIGLQMCAYALVWFQPPGMPFLPPVAALSGGAGTVLSVCVVALAVGSVWLVAAAVATLGQQWALAARLVEGHKLITEGPYRFVRNPIYTGMLGMLVGLIIRVRSEEKLLRAAFGKEFEDYAKHVPAVLPGIY